MASQLQIVTERLPRPAVAARVLVVDDEEHIRDIFSRWLHADGYRCDTAASAQEALGLLLAHHYDLVLSDLNMPGVSGIEFLERLRAQHSDCPTLVVTAVDERATAVRAVSLGAFGYLMKPITETELLINVENALERKRLRRFSEEHQERLEHAVHERTAEVCRVREEIAMLLAAASESRDGDTGAHVRRMGLYAEAMAHALGWDRQAATDLRLAATMHDVGKIGVRDSILLKPGRLTDEEFAQMKKHTDIGADILNGSKLPLLHLAGQIARSHHEKWDGSGYPEGRAGDAIPEAARLVAIVDVFDALVHDRVYREAMPESQALEIMEAGRGKHFDAAMLDVFLRLLPELRRIDRESAASAAGRIPRGLTTSTCREPR